MNRKIKMENIFHTIMEYKKSCALVRQRIEQLNKQIHAQNEDTGKDKALLDRRHLLYLELADLLSAIRAMEDYSSNSSLG